MEVYEAITRRRTIRKFKQDKLGTQLLRKLVNAARLAPSGSNMQPCEYIVVDDDNTLKQVFSTLSWAGYITPRGNPPEGKMPVAYIVVLINRSITEEGGTHDTAAAIQNILLTAIEEGVGTCWLGSIDRKQLRSMLSIPEGLDIDSIVALGRPDESPVFEEFSDSIQYYLDDDGVLHVPKRSLESITHRNRYGQS